MAGAGSHEGYLARIASCKLGRSTNVLRDVLMGSRFSGLRLRSIRLTRFAQSHELSLCGGESVCQSHLP